MTKPRFQLIQLVPCSDLWERYCEFLSKQFQSRVVRKHAVCFWEKVYIDSLAVNPMVSQAQTFPALLWKRTSAYIIDLLIITAITFPLLRTFSTTEEEITKIVTGGTQTLSATFVGITAALIIILYFSIFEYKFHQTLGKMLFKIEVVSAKKLTFTQCLLRSLSKISLVVLFIDTLYMLKSGSLRFLDKLAQTQVVEQERRKKV